MSGKPLLTFEHCSNQNLNNCLSRPRSCCLKHTCSFWINDCILCSFHARDSACSNNVSSWCVCFDFNRHFCKFSNERAPKAFESFTSMCIVSHQHQAFPVWWAKIDTESKQILQLYKLLEYTSYQYVWWKKQIKLNTRKMHICNKKKGTKLKRTPHSYPNIHNNKHPILKHEHRHLPF